MELRVAYRRDITQDTMVLIATDVRQSDVVRANAAILKTLGSIDITCTHLAWPRDEAAMWQMCAEELAHILDSGVTPFAQLRLFVVDDAWQYDNRISRYYALWRGLQKWGHVPPGHVLDEQEFRSSEGLRYAGCTALSGEDIVPAVHWICLNKSSFICAFRPSSNVSTATLYDDAFDSGLPVPSTWIIRPRLAARRCPTDAIVFPSGGWDDGEVELSLVAAADVIEDVALKLGIDRA